MRTFLCLLAVLPLSAQGLDVRCEPSRETLRTLEALPPVDDVSVPYEQRVGALRRLACENPGDFFIERAYQDAFRQKYYLGDEFDRALARYRQRTDPVARYWEARLLMYAQPKRSREVFEGLLKAHPEFVWPHVEFAEWAAVPGQQSAEAAPHRKAFAAGCPEALVPGMVLDAVAARRALERRNTGLDIALWPTLWAAEEKAGIGAEALQARVRNDIERIERLPLRPYPALLLVYREAARILRDEGVVQGLRVRVERDAPDSPVASALRQQQWERENPRPAPGDRKVYQAYDDKRAAAEREWLRHWPGDYASLQSLWHRITSSPFMGALASASPANLAIIDQWLRFGQATPDSFVQYPPVETALANFYVAARVRLDQVPRLLDLGLRNIEIQSKFAISPELLPQEYRSRVTDWRAVTATSTGRIRADYFLAMNRPAEARAVVEPALAKLEGQQGNRAQQDRIEWLRRLADVEAAEGRVQDALAHYQATLGLPKERIADAVAAFPKTAEIKAYYLAHGGSEEQWPEWASAKTGPANVTLAPTAPVFARALPDFSAKDLGGKTWRLSELNGKATLVNVWATWCGPCRGEHPSLEKLYQRLRDRTDVQVLTISVDDSPGAVRDYIKEQGYTFPVINSPELANRLFPYMGLPANFLVNAQGRRTSLYGFADGAEGIGRLLADLEKAAKPGI